MDRRQLLRLLAALGASSAAPGLVQANLSHAYLPPVSSKTVGPTPEHHDLLEPRIFGEIGTIGIGHVGRKTLVRLAPAYRVVPRPF